MFLFTNYYMLKVNNTAPVYYCMQIILLSLTCVYLEATALAGEKCARADLKHAVTSSPDDVTVTDDIRYVHQSEMGQIRAVESKLSHRRPDRSRHFKSWGPWSLCDRRCRQKRSRGCRSRRRCGDMQHTEYRLCNRKRCKIHKQGKEFHERVIKEDLSHFKSQEFEDIDEDHDSQTSVLQTRDLFYRPADNVDTGQVGKTGTGYRRRHKRIKQNKGIDAKGYEKWSKWSPCTRSCTTQRHKRCRRRTLCGRDVIRETAFCYVEGSFCQGWIHRRIKENEDKQTESSELFTDTIYKDRTNERTRKWDYYENDNANSISNFDCGFPYIKPKELTAYVWSMMRIIGGRAVYKGKWPWQVAVLNKYKEPFCGGTLISPRWIITAAHCVRKRLYVRLGAHNLETRSGSELEYKIQESIIHPNFDTSTVDNDVAMLMLPVSIKQTAHIGFACLPRSRQSLPVNKVCSIIGWGKRRSSDYMGTQVLHEAEVPIVPEHTCQDVYREYHITDNMFCAGDQRGRMDSCAGDSGGPLLCRDPTMHRQPWTIFGITSFGEGCGKKGKFGIYARLPNYVKWIYQVMNDAYV